MKTQIAIVLSALGLLACEETLQDALPQLIVDAGELVQDAGQVLTDAGAALHDASTADAQTTDASVPASPTRRALTATCDVVRTKQAASAGAVLETRRWSVFRGQAAADVRSAWLCGAGVQPGVRGCGAGDTCTGPDVPDAECTLASAFTAGADLWVTCNAGTENVRLIVD